MAADSHPSASVLAAFNRALEGEVSSWAKGREKDFSLFSSGIPCAPGEVLKNPRGVWEQLVSTSVKTSY